MASMKSKHDEEIVQGSMVQQLSAKVDSLAVELATVRGSIAKMGDELYARLAGKIDGLRRETEPQGFIDKIRQGISNNIKM